MGVKSSKGSGVSRSSSTSSSDIKSPLAAFGELLTAQLTPVFQNSFEYTVDNTELTSNAVVNGGSVTQANAMAVCTSSTTTASTAKLISKQHAKYRPGMGGLFRFTALFTTGVATTEQFIGILDEAGSSESFKNGYAIGMNGTDFSILRFQNDVLMAVAQSSFSEDPLDGTGPSGMTIDITKLNVFEIRFQYLGAGEIDFLVENPSTGLFFIFHKIEYSNAYTTPSVYNPNIHATLWVNNKATTSNIILKSASYAYFIEGKNNLQQIQQPEFSSGKRGKGTVTTEVALFTIRNKASYASKSNFIDIKILYFSIGVEASSANNLASFRIVRNATLGGSPSYSDINTSDSVMDIDTAGTTVTGGKEILQVELAGKNDRALELIEALNIIINPGETVTVAVSSENSATFNGSILWRELF